MFPSGPATTSPFRSPLESAQQNHPEDGNRSCQPASSPIHRMWAASAWATTTGKTPNTEEMPQLQARATPALHTTAPLWPSLPFDLGNMEASKRKRRRKPKHRHAHRSKRRAMSPILPSDESNAVKSMKQLLRSYKKKKPSRAKPFSTAFQNYAPLTARKSPHRMNHDASEPRDTCDALQPRRMRFYLQSPKKCRKAQQGGSPGVLLVHQPELPQTTPQEGSKGTEELHSDEVTTIFDVSQSLDRSTKPASTLEVHSSGSSTDTTSTSNVSVESSGTSGNTLTSETRQPSGESTQELSLSSNPARKPKRPSAAARQRFYWEHLETSGSSAALRH
ncbi:hypothetical protein MTO96_018190 [Rhipicephalus appendiculatus]